MSIVIELDDGQSAILKEIKELTNKEMKQIQQVGLKAAGLSMGWRDLGFDPTDPDTWTSTMQKISPEDMQDIDLYQRTCVVLRLKSWTLNRPIPTTVDEVDDLEKSIYDPLTLAAAQLSVDEQFGIEGAQDPKAGTANSAN